MLHTMPLLAGVPDAFIQAVRDRGTCVEVAGGEEVIRRWGADRFFYIALSGHYEVFIEDRMIRTLGPGEHLVSSPPVTGEAATATPVWPQ